MNAKWEDGQIHAFVDGELDATTALKLEADSRLDSVLAARIARQRELKQLLRSRFDPVLDEVVPRHLQDAVGGGAAGKVTPIGAARSARASRWTLREWGAIAASVALGAVLAPLFLGRGSGLPIESAGGRVVAAGVLDAALSRQISGRPDAASGVEVTLSFRSGSGQYCRAFVLRSGAPGSGLACRQGGRWTVELLEGAPPQDPAGAFRQAASAFSPALRGAMEARGAGEPLTPDEESERVGAGWTQSSP